MFEQYKYLQQGYFTRLFISLLIASLLAMSASLLLPEEFVRLNSPDAKNVRIDLIDLSAYLNNEANGAGGGGGGGPAREEKKTKANTPISLPENLAIPVPVPIAETSIVPDLNIPTQDTGLGLGIGEGSGTGSGRGSGIGNGIGDGIGDGAGGGIGGMVTPPRLLIMVVPGYPSAEVKQKNTVTVQLSVRVNQEGLVDSVIVISNPTGLSAFERSARQAAFASRYEPAKSGKNTVVCWTKCDYTFSRQ